MLHTVIVKRETAKFFDKQGKIKGINLLSDYLIGNWIIGSSLQSDRRLAIGYYKGLKRKEPPYKSNSRLGVGAE